MAIHEYPYTDFHELNLDWIIKEMKELIDEWDSFGGNVTATAHETLTPEVSVTGDLKTSLDFDFGLVRGNEGPQGPEGPEGPQGKGLEILGVYATLTDLQTAHPTGTAGDVYLVGSGGSFNLYVWSEDNSDWEDGGPITSPVPSSATPLMDNATASVGTSLNYSREDHVHPSDSSKQDALVSGTNIKTLNSYSLLGSGNLTVQPTLVSGTNIKTINSNDLLGSGDLTVQDVLVSGTNIKTINSNDLLGSGDITVQPTLVSGTNIKTINSESLLGSTDIAVQVPLVSGTNIKTINSQSLLGSGNIIISAAVTIDLLWTNANPTSNFAGQTISDLPISDYDYFVIVYNSATGASNRDHQSILVLEKDETYTTLVSAGGTFRTRKFTVNSSGSVTFQDNYNFPTYARTSDSTVDNSCCIPLYIYGIAI